MSELQPSARRLLDELTSGAEVPASERASVWEQLQASVERDAPPRIGEAPPSDEAAGGRRLWLAIGLGGALAAGLMLWMASTFTPMSSIVPAKEPIQAGYARASAEVGGEAYSAGGRTTASSPEAEDEAESITPEADTEAAPEPATDARPRRRRSTSRGHKRRKDVPSTSTGDLRAEMALLQSARQSLAGGRYSQALGQLREHQTKYPGSVFGEERVLLKLKALCGAGRIDAARTLLSTRRGARRAELEKACPVAVAPATP
ncbi:MAG: hypothetical protein AAF799_29165 [Myxococcota bacterium]